LRTGGISGFEYAELSLLLSLTLSTLIVVLKFSIVRRAEAKVAERENIPLDGEAFYAIRSDADLYHRNRKTIEFSEQIANVLTVGLVIVTLLNFF